MQAVDRKQFGVGLFLMSVLIGLWCYAIFGVTTDKHQGDVYRILYLHVPCALTAFLFSFTLFLVSLKSLIKPDGSLLFYGKANAEVGLLLTVLTLATGSIWGYPTWGTWWTWDARLTTTLILALLYCGYILLWNSLPQEKMRHKACAVLGILIFIDVPIIYKSVTWWRTLHQPPSLMRSGGSTMSSEMLQLLYPSLLWMVLVGAWLIWLRATNHLIQRDLEHDILSQLEES
ncbi:MAG: cytochrome c biogenesis protein CcsA [Oligoflexales bacterium]